MQRRESRVNQPLHFVEPIRVADREGRLHRDLEPVVRRRIVRGGDHHRAVEVLLGREEVNHRRRAAPEVRHLGPGLGESLHQRVMHRIARRAAVASHQPAPPLHDPGKRQSDPVDRIQIEIGTERTAHVIGFEKGHRFTSRNEYTKNSRAKFKPHLRFVRNPRMSATRLRFFPPRQGPRIATAEFRRQASLTLATRPVVRGLEPRPRT